MKKTSTKIIFSAVVALVIGYVLGIWIGFPNLNGDNLKGDIGKASKFSQKSTSDEIKAAEERLQNDTAYFQGVLATLNFADERINLFANLVSMTSSVCEGVDGLQPVLAQVQGLQGMAANAQSACNDAVAAVSAISKGEEANYEQAMNDISLAYAMVSRTSKIAKNVVSTFDRTIGSKHNNSANELAFVRDEWVRFAASEAFLQSDEVALDYWSTVNPLLANDVTLNMLNEDAKQEFQFIGAGKCYLLSQTFDQLLGQTKILITSFISRRMGDDDAVQVTNGYSESVSKITNTDGLSHGGHQAILITNNIPNLNLFRLSDFPSPELVSARQQ